MTREVCSLEVFARGVPPAYWAIVNAADGRALVTVYFDTRGALFESIAKWLCEADQKPPEPSPYEPGDTCFEGAYDQEGS
jgi:hypothetical protein